MKKNIFLKILLSFFILYTCIGFFIIPNILKSQIIKNLDNLLITKTNLEKIYFNPFTLYLELSNFSLKNEEKKIISFDRLNIKFSLLKSIHESHISFKEILLQKPYINIIQDENNNINLASILKEKKNNIKEKEEKVETQNSIPYFKINKTKIKDGNFLFTQLFQDKNTTTNINNFNYTFYDIGTFKNSLASHNLQTNINKDTKLFVKGAFRLIPFKMYGKVKLENLKAKEYIDYSKNLLNFDIGNPSLNLEFGYKVDTTKDLLLYLDKTKLDIKDLKLIKDNKELVSLNSLNINNLDFDYINQKIDIKNISLDNLETKILVNKNGNLNISNLINTKKTKESKIKIDEKEKPWNISLNTFNLNNSKLFYNDLKNENKISSENINILLKDISYINNESKIKKVTLNTKSLSINDNIKKTNIDSNNINIEINNLFQNDKILKLSSIDINKPITSIILNKKGEKIVNTIENKNQKSTTHSTFNLDMGPVNIKNAQLQFQDKNLPIPFKTNITQLNGNISELKTKSSKPSKLKIEGKVDKYGYTRITGLIDHKNIKALTDINIIFKNIAIKNFTPYSGKFVGRELTNGKLNLNLKYNIKKSNLDAKNSIIITDIKLGEVVKSKEAISLPLELGIALLEDSKGIIDLDVPISGNLDDPQFSIAPIVWKAITNLIIKAVSAPFTFLASLLGIDENEINNIEFIFGESKLLSSEKETLDKIANIFEKRPNIALEIEATYDNINDVKELQYQKIEALLNKDIKEIKAEDKYLKALENRYINLNNQISLKDLVNKFTINKDFNKELYINYLKEKVYINMIIKESELKELALNRLHSIKEYLKTTHNINEDRLLIKDTVKVSNEKNSKFIKFILGIDIKKTK